MIAVNSTVIHRMIGSTLGQNQQFWQSAIDRQLYVIKVTDAKSRRRVFDGASCFSGAGADPEFFLRRVLGTG